MGKADSSVWTPELLRRPLTDLNAPAEAVDALARSGVTTIKQLLSMRADSLFSGLQGVSRISRLRFLDHLASLHELREDYFGSPSAVIVDSSVSPPENIILWPLNITVEQAKKIKIVALGLPKDFQNALERNGIRNLYALSLCYAAAGGIRVGEKTMDDVREFFKTLTPEFLKKVLAETEETHTTPSDVPLDILVRPIEDLDVPPNVLHALRRMGLWTLGQLITTDEWMERALDFMSSLNAGKVADEVHRLTTLKGEYFDPKALDTALVAKLMKHYGFQRVWLTQWLDVSAMKITSQMKATKNRGRWLGAEFTDTGVFLHMLQTGRRFLETGASIFVILDRLKEYPALLTVKRGCVKCYFLHELPEEARQALLDAWPTQDTPGEGGKQTKMTG